MVDRRARHQRRSARWRRRPPALRRRSAFRCWQPRSPRRGSRRSTAGSLCRARWRSPCLQPPAASCGSAIRLFRGLPCSPPCCWARRWSCPRFLNWCWRWASKTAHRALAVWFWADSRQQISGLSLALMALLLALAVNVGVGTMVETFSRTFIVWLDGRLAADVYINASDDAQATEIKAWLRQRPEVQAILPGGRADTQIEGAPVEIFGLPDTPPIAITGRCCNQRRRLDPAAGRRCRFRQRAIGAALETRDRRSHRRAGAGRQLEARSGRHLCRLRQSEGADRASISPR